MKKPKAAKPEPAGPGAELQAPLSIDFPHAGETVTSAEYAVRLTAPEPGGVEVSIDHGPWLPCREAVGHWWFDWSGYAAGAHHIQARLQAPDGRLMAVKSRRVTVSAP